MPPVDLTLEKYNGEFIRELIEAQAASLGVRARIDWRAGYAVLVNTKAETDFAREVALDLVGPDQVTLHGPALSGSEDFSFMLERVPGSYLLIGNGATEADLGLAFDGDAFGTNLSTTIANEGASASYSGWPMPADRSAASFGPRPVQHSASLPSMTTAGTERMPKCCARLATSGFFMSKIVMSHEGQAIRRTS